MIISLGKKVSEEKETKTIQLSAFENQQRDILSKGKTISRFIIKATKTKMAP
ncbi:MAG: hypothetical protein IPP49_20095 [Saprospiraceae bacterium]|nr:hypothetical protein [Saprospiraceae bacterium]